MDRREFIRRAANSGLLAAGSGFSPLFAACETVGTGAVPRPDLERSPFRTPPVRELDGLLLTARRDLAPISPRVDSPVWTLGEPAAVGATLSTTRGSRVRARLLNQLDEATIVHWHGLRPPEASDGHPRLAIGPGASYAYDFDVSEPAGLYWYHSHAHMRTGIQTYMGMAGLIVVRDPLEDQLGLPGGRREIPMVIQDKRLDASGGIAYDPFGPDMMEGFLGDTPFVNGVRSPALEVDTALYRFRVLNASNARIFRVARSDGRPIVLIGGDAGFLPAPVTVPYVDLGTGERADLLIDFSDLAVGTRLFLRSLAFDPPAAGRGGMGMGMGGMMGGMSRGAPQGAAMDLVELQVSHAVREQSVPPTSLPSPIRLTRADAQRSRTFRFDSFMMDHTINGRRFDMERVDERIPFGSTELWTFVNDSTFPHPIHMHAVHFFVVSRSGGRGRVLPWETGAKDTVLVLPGERVEVVARFEHHRGLFLLHCHNLEHEDMGMMMNFLIE